MIVQADRNLIIFFIAAVVCFRSCSLVESLAWISLIGLFTVYQSGNKIFYEIPYETLGRDMAIMSRIAKTAEELGWGGDRLAGQQVV